MSEPQAETREELLQYLEKLTGWTFRTRADVQAYVRELAERKATEERSGRGWLNAKQITFGALLVFGVLQYYMFDVLLDIASMRSTVFFVPATTRVLTSMLNLFA